MAISAVNHRRVVVDILSLSEDPPPSSPSPPSPLTTTTSDEITLSPLRLLPLQPPRLLWRLSSPLGGEGHFNFPNLNPKQQRQSGRLGLKGPHWLLLGLGQLWRWGKDGCPWQLLRGVAWRSDVMPRRGEGGRGSLGQEWESGFEPVAHFRASERYDGPRPAQARVLRASSR